MKKKHTFWKIVFGLALVASLIGVIAIVANSFSDIAEYVCYQDKENHLVGKDYYFENVLESALTAVCVLVAHIFSAFMLYKLSKKNKIKRAEKLFDRINKLYGYYQSGSITQEEYEALREEIMRQADV